MTPPTKDLPLLSSLEEGEAALESTLQALRTDVQNHIDAFEGNLDRDLTRPIRKAFAAALEAHSQAMAGLPQPSDEGGPKEWTSLRRYREAVGETVLDPLMRELQGLEIGPRVGSLWEGFQDGLPLLARDLPESVIRVEPQDLFAGNADDGSWTRLRKSLVRGWRVAAGLPSGAARRIRILMGSDPPPSPPLTQTVLLRYLAQECLHGHCPLNLTPFSEAFHQHFAQISAQLMESLAGWNRHWFPLEESFHTPQGHLEEEVFREIMGSSGAVGKEKSETPQGIGEGGEAGGDPQTDRQEATLLSEELVGIAKGLHETLQRGADYQGPHRPLERVRNVMEGEWSHLLEEIRVFGSFQSDAGNKASRSRLAGMADRHRVRRKHWEDWHIRSLSRIQLTVILIRLRERWDKAEDDFFQQISEKAVCPLASGWRGARDGMLALESQARNTLSDPARGDPDQWAGSISTFLASATEILQTNLAPSMEGGTFRTAIEGVADSAANAMADALRVLPEQITVIPLPDEPGRVEPETPGRPFLIRDVVLNTMDVLRLESLRRSPAPLLDLLGSAAQRASEISSIVEYNLNAASKELLTPPAGPMEATMEDARGLVLDGLEKTAQGLEAFSREIPTAWTSFSAGLHGPLAQTFQELHTRAVAEGTVQEQILDIRALLRTRLRAFWELSRAQLQGLLRGLSRLLKKGWLRALRGIQMVRVTMGVHPVARSEAERALEVLRSVSLLLDPLPLVYRRLFSFSPVSDPSLLVSRKEEVEWVMRRYQSWKDGGSTPNLITAPLGGGHTSLLNTMDHLLAKETRVIRAKMDARFESEEALAGFLAGLLNLEISGAWSFDKFIEAVSANGKRNPGTVLFLEGIEHAFLRTLGGTDLFRRLLSVQAKTSGRIFWLSTTSTTAWKLLSKIEPEACQLMATRALSPFDTEGLRTLVMTRHQRSGLDIEFLPPSDLNPWTRRRLRLARGKKAKQDVLRAEFFDRLFRMSGGSAPMAILLWLRSADFSSERGLLRVQPPNPVRFTFLEDLPLSLNFALMAFLEHGSLNLEEYSTVFGVSRDEAYEIFEALRSSMLLEPMGGEGALPKKVDRIDPEGRYRLPPILVQAISQQLRNRNILH